ncbi:MAG: PLDc N-terminal domain-containing protein [Oryzomonas sp.]|uniref:PLDc N-terminal domain-containing protein n=1 Tax=Oryzomonas sp. TaxID=2855186 RepID=UPI0028445D82|nr:PLDc N-terminal domain-containing protein [Oryzomonas sp.]MDR3579619.1 PLDc N-terminal domain-containing protein [Oryzomonas sp.]
MKTVIIIYLLVLLAPVASAEVYRWEDENGINFTDDPASVPEKYREKVASETMGQIKEPAPHVRVEATRRKIPVVTQEKQIAAYQDGLERQRPATGAIRQIQGRAVAVNARNAKEPFPSLATAVVVCILSTLFLAIAWIATIFDISKSEFITPSIKAAWMVVVIFIPGVGMMLYYILGLGQKKIRSYLRQRLKE